MNNTDEYYTVNDRQYLNPNVPLKESNDFIQKLRDTQTADTNRINTETHNLGTNVPSNLGGLGGAESVWKNRYQDPQTNSMISGLKSTAQAQALNTTLNNLMSQKQKEYSDLYKKKVKEAATTPTTTPTTGGNTGPNVGTPTDDGKYKSVVSDGGDGTTTISMNGFAYVTDNQTGYKYTFRANEDGTIKKNEDGSAVLYSTTDPSQEKNSEVYKSKNSSGQKSASNSSTNWAGRSLIDRVMNRTDSGSGGW